MHCDMSTKETMDCTFMMSQQKICIATSNNIASYTHSYIIIILHAKLTI